MKHEYPYIRSLIVRNGLKQSILIAILGAMTASLIVDSTPLTVVCTSAWLSLINILLACVVDLMRVLRQVEKKEIVRSISINAKMFWMMPFPIGSMRHR